MSIICVNSMLESFIVDINQFGRNNLFSQIRAYVFQVYKWRL